MGVESNSDQGKIVRSGGKTYTNRTGATQAVQNRLEQPRNRPERREITAKHVRVLAGISEAGHGGYASKRDRAHLEMERGGGGVPEMSGADS